MAPGVGLGWLRVVGGILLVVLLIGLAGWWYYNNDAMPTDASADILPEEISVADMPGGLQAGGDMATTPAEQDRVVASRDGLADTSRSQAEEPADAVAEAGEGQALSQQPTAQQPSLPAAVPPRSQSATSTAESREAGAVTANASPDDESLPESTTEGAADGVQRTIELAFSEECWVEVYDSNGRALLYDLQTANSRRVVTAQGPVRVFLGNAPAVSIKVDGEAFALSDFTRRDNTARFGIPTSR